MLVKLTEKAKTRHLAAAGYSVSCNRYGSNILISDELDRVAS